MTIHTQGAGIALVVSLTDGKYVIGRKQQSSHVVLCIEHINAQLAAF